MDRVAIRIRKLWRARAGTAAVEFAMVFPLLIVLMIGVLMIGQAFYTVSSVQWAIEKSARELMISPSLTAEELEQKVHEVLSGLTDFTVEIALSDAQSQTFPVTRVLAEITYPVEIPLVPAFEINYRIENLVPRPYVTGG